MAWRRRYANLPGPVRTSGEFSNGAPVMVEMYLAGAWVDVTSYVLTRDGGQKITRTLGDVQLNVAALSNNLVRPTGNAAGPPRAVNGGLVSQTKGINSKYIHPRTWNTSFTPRVIA